VVGIITNLAQAGDPNVKILDSAPISYDIAPSGTTEKKRLMYEIEHNGEVVLVIGDVNLLLTQLKHAFPEISDVTLRGIYQKTGASRLVHDINLKNAINGLGANKSSFFSDLAGDLGGHINSLTPDHIGGWNKLKQGGSVLKSNITALKIMANLKFATRFNSNPKLIKFLESYTDEGRTTLLGEIDNWAKVYDARPLVLTGDVNAAASHFGGTVGVPKPYNGANYVNELEGFVTASPADLNNIINSTTDVAAITNRLGVSQDIVQAAKQHLFVTEHIVEVEVGVFVKGRFATYAHNAEWWKDVANGSASSEVRENFRKLIAHEYVEGQLMEKGMLYKRFDVDPSPGRFGAHDLSVNDATFNFKIWTIDIKRTPPPNPQPNLSNLDQIVNDILTKEGF
jgi:hypothetical protein